MITLEDLIKKRESLPPLSAGERFAAALEWLADEFGADHEQVMKLEEAVLEWVEEDSQLQYDEGHKAGFDEGVESERERQAEAKAERRLKRLRKNVCVLGPWR